MIKMVSPIENTKNMQSNKTQQFVILGLGSFGRGMVEEFHSVGVGVLIIDRNKERIDLYKKKATSAYIIDVMKHESLERIISDQVDAVIVDLGSNLEASIFVTHQLNKLKIKRILVCADTDEHAEILKLVGATKVIFSNREAAKRVAPLLVSTTLLNCLPVPGDLVIAETLLPAGLAGKNVLEAELRKSFDLEIMAVKKNGKDEYCLIAPDYRFVSGDVLLIVGQEEGLVKFSGYIPKDKKSLLAVFKRLFSKQVN